MVQNGAPVLDRFGNVVGGLRSPYLDVPTSTWYGSSTGASFCFIAGHEVPFSKGLLQQIYPDHAAYVRAVSKDTRALVKQGFITNYDGAALIREAQQADVPSTRLATDRGGCGFGERTPAASAGPEL